MTVEEYEEARKFAAQLVQRRIQISDGQLLDECQQWLNLLLEQVADDFEVHEQPEMEVVRHTVGVVKKRSHHKKKTE